MLIGNDFRRAARRALGYKKRLMLWGSKNLTLQRWRLVGGLQFRGDPCQQRQ